MTLLLPPSWQKALAQELTQPYLKELLTFLSRERAGHIPVYPSEEEVFAALQSTPYDDVKVVILGQDPYHGPGQANGLAFAVSKLTPIPPSLRNIYQELNADLGIPIPSHGCLTSWANQGVLLLNATLTVADGSPRSHYGKGWEQFTDAIVAQLSKRNKPTVFMLWGKSAQDKVAKFESQGRSPNHLILTAPHPSPLSAHRGFLGCRHFSKANLFLSLHGLDEIKWEIPE